MAASSLGSMPCASAKLNCRREVLTVTTQLQREVASFLNSLLREWCNNYYVKPSGLIFTLQGIKSRGWKVSIDEGALLTCFP